MKFHNFSLLHNDHKVVSHDLLAKALRMIESDAKKGVHLVDFGSYTPDCPDEPSIIRREK